MPKFKIATLITLLFIVALSTSGCVSVNTGAGNTNIDGGVFKTINYGTQWQQKVLIPTVSGRPRSFAGINVASMTIDPSDHKAIYFGSVGNGLLYTYDGGDNWRTVETLETGTINAVAVDPNSKCIIYAAIGNRVYRSSDCNRTWKRVYYDNDLAATIDEIVIDHYNSSTLYIGISRGDIIKSNDRGETWQTVYRINDKIKKMVIDPGDSRVIYVAGSRKGVFLSENSGADWKDLKKLIDAFKEYGVTSEIKDLVVSNDGEVFLATFYGLLKSSDRGDTWERINLIPPERKATINAIAINPSNTKEVYYATDTTFYRSQDGGENWGTIKLPTSRAGWEVIVDPVDTNMIYLGVRALK